MCSSVDSESKCALKHFSNGCFRPKNSEDAQKVIKCVQDAGEFFDTELQAAPYDQLCACKENLCNKKDLGATGAGGGTGGTSGTGGSGSGGGAGSGGTAGSSSTTEATSVTNNSWIIRSSLCNGFLLVALSILTAQIKL